MADYYCNLSVAVKCQSQAYAVALSAMFDTDNISDKDKSEWGIDEEETYIASTDIDGTTVYVWDDESGNIDAVASILQSYLFNYDPKGVIGFEWANTCSKPRPGDFGGGAVVITAFSQDWMNTGNWLTNKLAEIEDRHNES